MSDPFVHLHVASGYSLHYGASHPHVLVERAAEQEMDALALTDRDGTYGAVRFVKACRSLGVRPILGVDLAMAGFPAPVGLPPPARASTPVRGGTYRDTAATSLPRVTFLASGKTGWAALCRLVSATHQGGERGQPVCTPALVAEHVAGRDVLALLGPWSSYGAAAARLSAPAAKNLAHSPSSGATSASSTQAFFCRRRRAGVAGWARAASRAAVARRAETWAWA